MGVSVTIYTYFTDFRSSDLRREKPLTVKPIRMLILATIGADIKTVDKYWLYRELRRKMPIPVARSSAIDICGANDDLLASKIHRLYIFSIPPRSYTWRYSLLILFATLSFAIILFGLSISQWLFCLTVINISLFSNILLQLIDKIY